MPMAMKGDSPFYPGQPVPVESFIGREKEIQYIMERGVGPTSRGKPTCFFLQGEYGIGKSSLALYTQKAAKLSTHGLLGIYTTLGGVKTLADLAAVLLESTIRSGIYDPQWGGQLKEWLGTYIGKQTLFGLTLDLEKLKQEAPKIASPTQILGFLTETLQRYKSVSKGTGIFWIMDEINGIAAEPTFVQFLKSLIDTNAFQEPRLPLLLMLCGVEERRQDMIRAHQPADRLFDVVDIQPLSTNEMEVFFQTSFQSVGMNVSQEAMLHMTQAAAGFPKIMHLIGDKVFLEQPTGSSAISAETALQGILAAADTVGKTLVDGAVYAALQSEDYKSILAKIGPLLGFTTLQREFTRKELAQALSPREEKKLGNFLTRMKNLKVIKQGQSRGYYAFRMHIVQMYIWLRSQKAQS